jgi:hypothetical protein
MIVYAPGGTDLPASRLDGAEGSLALVEGVTHERDNLNRIFNPASPGEEIHGLIAFPGGIGPTIMTGVGWLISDASQAMHDWAGNHLLPGLSNLGMGVADLTDIAGQVLTHVGQGINEWVDDVGTAAEDLINGNLGKAAADIWSSGTDLAGGVFSAAKGVSSDLGHAFWDIAVTPAAQAVQAVPSAVGYVGGAVGSVIGSAVQDAGDVIRSVAQDVGSAIGSAAQDIGDDLNPWNW